MTLDEAKPAIKDISERSLIDDISAVRCAAHRDGCEVMSYDYAADHPERVSPDFENMSQYAAYCKPCKAHAASKRFSWVADIDPQAFADFCNAPGREAFQIEDLRPLLAARTQDRGGFSFL